MKNTVRTGTLTAAALMLTTAMTWAHDYGTDTLKIEHPWARPTFTEAVPGAAYMTIRNTADEDDRLLAVVIPGAVADMAELHTTVVENGIARMRQARSGLPVPAGGTLRLEPLGNHIMLIGLKEKLVVGAKFKAALLFETAGRVEVEFWVEQPADDDTGDVHHEHH
ncbi:MAG: copper chaperone PCu(A)C [Pseudomonadota bacterium]